MIGKYEQPSEAQELANAAYVWRIKVQTDLVTALRDTSIKPEAAEFWFERFRRAYRNEIETEAAAKGQPMPIKVGMTPSAETGDNPA